MRIRIFLLFIFLSTALLPFCYACLYALPFADDFCYAWTAAENIAFHQKFLNHYLNWNGRYTADLLACLHPLLSGEMLAYSLVLLVSILVTPIVLFGLLRVLTIPRSTSVLAALFLSLLYFNYMPNITEGLYWYMGIINYHLANLVFVLQLSLFIYLLRKQSRNYFLWAINILLLFVAIGFNELSALLVICFYGVAFVLRYKSANRKLWLLFFLLAGAFAALVFFSPGNIGRGSEFTEAHQFLRSAIYAAAQTIRFTGTWVINAPFAALSIFVIMQADKLPFKPDWRICLAFAFFCVFMAAFVPYFFTGILGQHRTMNLVFPWFLLLWLAALPGLSDKLRLTERWQRWNTSAMQNLLLFSSVLALFVSGNSLRILNDARKNHFQAYQKEFMQRQQNIIAKTAAPIPPLKNIPKTFTIVDAKNDTAWWPEKCMRHFYKSGLKIEMEKR